MRNLYRSLLLSLSLVAGFAHALAAEPVAGTDYEVLKPPHPTSAPPGKVEVIEFFWYGDPLCYQLEPAIEAFVKKEGDRILFKRVPVILWEQMRPHWKLYYSLVQLGWHKWYLSGGWNGPENLGGSLDDWKVAPQLLPMDEEGGLKQEWRKQCREDQVFGQSDLRRKRQDREGDPRENSRNGNLCTLRCDVRASSCGRGVVLPLTCSATSAYAPARTPNVI